MSPAENVEVVRRMFEALGEGDQQSFDHFDFTVHAITSVGDDRVFMRLRLAGEGKASGMSLDGETPEAAGLGE
jgi:hypothetical protein